MIKCSECSKNCCCFGDNTNMQVFMKRMIVHSSLGNCFQQSQAFECALRGCEIFWFRVRVRVTLGFWLFPKCSAIQLNVWAF